jgi:aryl-alcohol dehydrogenase-like predicted oxidoreductase
MTEPLRLPQHPLGRTGISISRLGLSGRSFTARGLPERRVLPSEDVERAFHELGVTTFLFSPGMKGIAEGLRRLIRAGHRQDLVIMAGVGIPTGWGVRRAFERQARVLGVDHFDIFLLGWVRARWHVTGKTWPTMRHLKEEGKVRAIAFSCHNRALALALQRELDVDLMMLRYNAAHRGVEREVFAHLGPDRPGIVSYTATRWGMLLQPLPAQGFPEPMTAPECYRFALAHPAVDGALCAARTYAELEEDVAGVLAGPLPPERLAEVLRFGDAVHRTARGGARFMFRQG